MPTVWRTGQQIFKVLSYYEEVGVSESIETWQFCRAVRNLAAHDYEIDYAGITIYFNALCFMLYAFLRQYSPK